MVADRSSTKRAGTFIGGADDLYEVFSEYRNKRQEHFLAATLDAGNKVIRIYVITIGTVSHTIIAPRELFYPAILDNAVSVALAHNHPSGQASPSKQDDKITAMLVEAGNLIGIQVLDHLIITKNGFYSYAREERLGGLLNMEQAWAKGLEAGSSTSRTRRSSTS